MEREEKNLSNIWYTLAISFPILDYAHGHKTKLFTMFKKYHFIYFPI